MITFLIGLIMLNFFLFWTALFLIAAMLVFFRQDKKECRNGWDCADRESGKCIFDHERNEVKALKQMLADGKITSDLYKNLLMQIATSYNPPFI